MEFVQRLAKLPPFADKGTGALFLIQLFATLSYSVLYSTLILYITESLHFSDVTATELTASFIALNYGLHILGGYIGGRYLSYRSLFAFGMVAEVIGCCLISIPTSAALYLGLAIFLAGAGVNLTCLNCMLTQIFAPTDQRREAAFLWNYSGMNIGFFMGFTLSGYCQQYGIFRELFLFSAMGNVIALLVSFKFWSELGDRYTYLASASASARVRARMIGVTLLFLLAFSLWVLLQQADLSNYIIFACGILLAVVVSVITLQQKDRVARNKLWAYLILAITSVVFWALYQMGPMSLTLFIQRNVDRHFLGFLIQPQWVQNINTVVIVTGGPILAAVFQRMRKKGTYISVPFQFSCALILIGVSFVLLPIGIFYANAQGYVNFNWVILNYVLQSLGELFISPIGFAMIGELVPEKLQGFLMGIWLMTAGVSATLANYFSKLALGSAQAVDPLVTNASFAHSFGMLGGLSIAAGVVLLILTPFVRNLITPTPPKNPPLPAVSAA